MGGGTPSLFSLAHIDRPLRALDARLKLNPGRRNHPQANPGTLEIVHRRLSRGGVNRLSIGVQSLTLAT